MTDTSPTLPPQAEQLFVSDEPAKIAAYIKSRRQPADPDTASKTPYNFADFVGDMQMTNFEDDYEMRAMLESQAHLLASAFQYLMIEGDWKNLAFTLRTQKVMRDTMELMNHYPMLSWHRPRKETGQEGPQNAAHLD